MEHHFYVLPTTFYGRVRLNLASGNGRNNHTMKCASQHTDDKATVGIIIVTREAGGIVVLKRHGIIPHRDKRGVPGSICYRTVTTRDLVIGVVLTVKNNQL